MVISFVVHNKSEIVQEFEIKMIQDDDTHFLAAGNQMVCFNEHLGVRGRHSVSVTRIVENLSYHCSPHLLPYHPSQHHFRVLPSGTYTLNYNLIPLQAGRVTLPIFHISYCREPQAYDALLRHEIPTHMEIMVWRGPPFATVPLVGNVVVVHSVCAPSPPPAQHQASTDANRIGMKPSICCHNMHKCM